MACGERASDLGRRAQRMSDIELKARDVGERFMAVPAPRRAETGGNVEIAERELRPEASAERDVVESRLAVEVRRSGKCSEEVRMASQRHAAVTLPLHRHTHSRLGARVLVEREVAYHCAERIRARRAIDIAVACNGDVDCRTGRLSSAQCLGKTVDLLRDFARELAVANGSKLAPRTRFVADRREHVGEFEAYALSFGLLV